MPEYDNIVPQNVGELEPLGAMTVKRQKTIPTEFESLNYIQNCEEASFGDLKSAFEWASKAPEYMHEFVFPVAGARLAGSLNFDFEKNDEVLMLTSGTRTGISPKEIEGDYFAVTDNKNYFYIVFTPYVNYKNMIKGRSVFLSLPSQGTVPILHFSINPGVHEPEDMAIAMTEVLKKITKTMNKLLDGYYDHP